MMTRRLRSWQAALGKLLDKLVGNTRRRADQAEFDDAVQYWAALNERKAGKP